MKYGGKEQTSAEDLTIELFKGHEQTPPPPPHPLQTNPNYES